MSMHRASSLLQEEKRRSSVLDYEEENKLRLGTEALDGQASRLRKEEVAALGYKKPSASAERASARAAQRRSPSRLLHSENSTALRAAGAFGAARRELEDAVDADREESRRSGATGVVERLAQARRGARPGRRTQPKHNAPEAKAQARNEAPPAVAATAVQAQSGIQAKNVAYAAVRRIAEAEREQAAWARASAAKGASAKDAALPAGPSGGPVGMAAVGIIGIVAVMVFLLLTLTGALSAVMVKKSYGAGDLSGLPGWVTAEFVEECLYIQEKYGLSAAVAIAQAQLETGGCWNGTDFTLNGQPYDLVNVAHNHFCCTTGSSPGNRWEAENNEVTFGGEPFYSPFSPGYTWRKYDSARQAIHDRARILLNEETYSVVRAAAFKSTDKQVEAISNSAWCEGGYGSLMEYVDTYDLRRFDGMTVAMWRATGDGGGEIVSLTGGKLGNPLSGQQWVQSSPFGWRGSEYHKGLDMAAAEGTPYYAAESGTVLYATNDGGYNGGAGNWVVIDHGGGLVTKYMHSSATFVTPGQQVKKGQHIGNVGNTGQSYGAHLHFQVEVNGQAVDPLPYIGG